MLRCFDVHRRQHHEHLSMKRLHVLGVAAVLGAGCRGILGIEPLPGTSGSDGGASADGANGGLDGTARGDSPNEGQSTSDGGGVDAPFDGPLGADADRRWAHWPLPPVAPTHPSYDLQNETVFDKTTGLMWHRAVAQSTMYHSAALSHCFDSRIGGFADWRLPTRLELLSILDYGEATNLTDATVFPNPPASPASTRMWSASVDGTDPAKRWYVDGDDGTLGSGVPGSFQYNVRCVRLGRSGRDAPRYDVASGTAYDPRTGLTWQQGMRATTTILSEAQNYCQTLTLAGGGWRLPSIRELHTLFDESAAAPPLWDQSVFQISGGAYSLWSGTLRTNPADRNYIVDFNYGNSYAQDPTNPAGVRCVK
jgi:hypothetical protein